MKFYKFKTKWGTEYNIKLSEIIIHAYDKEDSEVLIIAGSISESFHMGEKEYKNFIKIIN